MISVTVELNVLVDQPKAMLFATSLRNQHICALIIPLIIHVCTPCMWQLTHQVMSELMNHLMNQFIRFKTMFEDHWRSDQC